MKPRTFLGKPIPSQTPLPPPRGRRGFSWTIWIAAPVVLIGAGAWLNYNAPIPGTRPRTAAVSSPQTLADVQAERVLGAGTLGNSSAAATASSGPKETATSSCDLSDATIAAKFNAKKIFPILPSEILDPYTAPGCSPPYWNMGIIVVLAYKMVGLLDYIAAILAVLFTVYAGLLYIGGFANESYVGTAKKILTASYAGLAIVIFARLILYAPVQFFTSGNVTTTDNLEKATQQNLESTSSGTGT